MAQRHAAGSPDRCEGISNESIGCARQMSNVRYSHSQECKTVCLTEFVGSVRTPGSLPRGLPPLHISLGNRRLLSARTESLIPV